MLVLAIDVSNLLVHIAQLHMVFIHLIVIHHFVDLLYPLIIEEHRVVSLSNYLLAAHELVILRFQSKP